MSENCTKCGSDSYEVREFPRLLARYDRLEREHIRTQMEHARDDAKFRLALWRQEESMRYLQQKTRRQAAVIRRMEKRLLALNKEPYGGAENG